MPGYSKTPLPDKLGIRPGSELCVASPPPNYRQLVHPLPEDVRITRDLSETADLVHLFVTERSTLEELLPYLRSTLAPDAVVWVSWPKKAARVRTDVTENTIRELALPLGFVDVKVCAVTDVWSGLKLVVRKELR